MVQPKFRLEAKLSILKSTLERNQMQLATELRKLREYCQDLECQIEILNQAFDGQVRAGQSSPLDLGLWHTYTQRQLTELEKRKGICVEQEFRVQHARNEVLEVYTECKKLERIKQKQAQAYIIKESKREQAIQDETGQIFSSRKRLNLD